MRTAVRVGSSRRASVFALMTRTDDFAYDLPRDAIAQAAIEPRDSARLLEARSLADRTFSDLPLLLRPGDLLVVNSTRVRAARLMGSKRGTGGSVEVLLLERFANDRWTALCRPARRLRVGQRLSFGRIDGEVVTAPESGVLGLRLWSEAGDVEDVLPTVGVLPLPPYFRGRLADPERYQTMFAKRVGSAAAPTAGLHFTPRLVAALADNDIVITDVDLIVGLDTFRPISAERIEDHEIHTERYGISPLTAELIATATGAGRRIVAIGTTVVRALESSATNDGRVVPGEREATMFIRPGYRFRAVDAVVTNFHAPGTSLVVMIAAMLGHRWRHVYATAIDRRYRFLSFGDAMYIDGLRD